MLFKASITSREIRTDVACDVTDGCLLLVRNIDRWKDRVKNRQVCRNENSIQILISRFIDEPSLIAIKIYGSITNRRRIYLSLSLSLVRRWVCLMDAFQGRSRRRCKQRFSIWSTCRGRTRLGPSRKGGRKRGEYRKILATPFPSCLSA